MTQTKGTVPWRVHLKNSPREDISMVKSTIKNHRKWKSYSTSCKRQKMCLATLTISASLGPFFFSTTSPHDFQTERQTSTAIEGIRSNASLYIGDGDARQRAAASEGKRSNCCHWIWDPHALQRAAVLKGSLSDLCHRVWNCHALQRVAVKEGPVPDVYDRIWNCEARQRAAAIEGIPSNFYHRIWDCQARQRRAVHEGHVPNARHWRWDDDPHQGLAAMEGKVFNFGRAIRDLHIKQLLCGEQVAGPLGAGTHDGWLHREHRLEGVATMVAGCQTTKLLHQCLSWLQ